MPGPLREIRFRGNDIPDNWAAAVADHEAFMGAIARRDGKAAGAVLQRHLQDSWLRLADSLGIDPNTLAPIT